MKILISISVEDPLKLRTDNPGGRWLQDERKYNESQGKNRHGSPVRFGALTGSWNRQVLLPTTLLVGLKGCSGEHNAVRKESLDWLTKHMKRYKRLPLETRKQHYAPFITIWQDGTPWINEGNHRIRAAAQLGYRYLPVELTYFSGAETRPGPLNPTQVEILDAEARHLGYTLTDYAR